MLRVNSLLDKLWTSTIIEETEEEIQSETMNDSITPSQKDIQEIREDQDSSSIAAYEVDQEITKVPEQIDAVDKEVTKELEQTKKDNEPAIEESEPTKEPITIESEVVIKEAVVEPVKGAEEESEPAKELVKGAEEEDVNKLKVDTRLASDTAIHIIESPIEEIPHYKSSISSASSIPVVTPTSSQSTPTYIRREQPVTPRQRKTSLLRRETDKFNDRRKSLTKKLRKALTVDLR